MNENVRKTLNIIIDKFKSGDIPEAVAYSVFPLPDIPSSNWSMLNRTLMVLSGTMDARTFYQWNSVNRSIKKGSKAFYIIVPFMKTVEADGTEIQFISGFGCKPVFKLEDTTGAEVTYENLTLPDLPLIERAQSWGVSVKAVPGNFKFYGYYAPGKKEIALATSQESVFFHELSHCAHHIIKGELKPGQDPLQEVVAELCAQSLALIVGKSAEDTTGNSYRYISRYAEEAGLSVQSACMRVLSEAEKILELILTGQVRDKRQPHKKVA